MKNAKLKFAAAALLGLAMAFIAVNGYAASPEQFEEKAKSTVADFYGWKNVESVSCTGNTMNSQCMIKTKSDKIVLDCEASGQSVVCFPY